MPAIFQDRRPISLWNSVRRAAISARTNSLVAISSPLKPLPICSAMVSACSWGRPTRRIACAISSVSTAMECTAPSA